MLPVALPSGIKPAIAPHSSAGNSHLPVTSCFRRPDMEAAYRSVSHTGGGGGMPRTKEITIISLVISRAPNI